MSAKIKIAWFVLLIGALLAAGCGARSATEMGYSDQPLVPQEVFVEVAREAGGFSASTPPLDVERLVIKDASLTIVVDDPSASMEAIGQMAEEMGGFIVSAQLYQTRLESGAEVPQASITVRVPAERLNEALASIRSQSEIDPLSENINSQDVTSDYTDLQSRLRNLEATEAQLTEIMDSASKTEDVLAVYSQLSQVREQIEVIKGQILYYERSAALSAISVELKANEAVKPLTIGNWQPVGVAKEAIQALINALKFLADAAIWIVLLILPVLLVLYVVFVLPFTLLLRTWRKRRSSRKQAPPPAE